MQTYTIDIRPRRQTTLPSELLNTLGLSVGDSLQATVRKDEIILKSKKKVALDALKQLQQLIKASGISEKEMQENLVRIRKELNEKRYT